MKSHRVLAIFAVLSLSFSALFGGYRFYQGHTETQTASAAAIYKTPSENDVFVRFDMEIFDILTKEYWQKGTEADLAELFRLALEKAAATTETLPSKDRSGAASMLAARIAVTPEEKKKQLAVDIGIVAIANLAPQGRSGLLSEKQERELRDAASNIDRNNSLYSALGVEDGASKEKVQEAFVEKKAELIASSSPAAKEVLKDVERAHEVLADVNSKEIYDQSKIQPSVVSSIKGGKTLYLNLSKVTPATLQEFVNTLEKTKDNPALTGMIVDVRGNVGGTLDFAKYLLALFIGPNQYAFDLFHQGDLKVERTPAVAKIPSLGNFKDIAILTDSMTQSTAELTATIFKRMRLAKVIGTKTRGWGTVENTFPISTQISEDEKYAVFLVHSLTLREDNEPIEGKGVDPDIDINSADWKQRVQRSFETPGFASAIFQSIESH